MTSTTWKWTVLAAGLVATQSASAGYISITGVDPHQDKQFNPLPVGNQAPGVEDGRVEWNAVANQTWDLENFYFDKGTGELKMVGGFNFVTGQGYNSDGLAGGLNGTPYPMGDIFVYINPTAGQPYTVPNATDNNGPWGGKDDWDYAVAFVRGSDGNIKVTAGQVEYVITANNGTVYTPTGTTILKSDLPWKAASVDFSSPLSADYWSSGDQSLTRDTWINYIGDIDLSAIYDPLGEDDVLYFHTTMMCGNDVMWGKTSGVPDGGLTLLMLGAGLSGLALLRRRVD